MEVSCNPIIHNFLSCLVSLLTGSREQSASTLFTLNFDYTSHRSCVLAQCILYLFNVLYLIFDVCFVFYRVNVVEKVLRCLTFMFYLLGVYHSNRYPAEITILARSGVESRLCWYMIWNRIKSNFSLVIYNIFF